MQYVIVLIFLLVIYIAIQLARVGGGGRRSGGVEIPRVERMRGILTETHILAELIKAAKTINWLDEINTELELPRPIPGTNATLQDEHLKRLLIDLKFISTAPPGPINYFAGELPNSHKIADIVADITGREIIFISPYIVSGKKIKVAYDAGAANISIYHTDWFVPNGHFIAKEKAPYNHTGRKMIAPFASREGEVYTTETPAESIPHIQKKLDYYNYVHRPYGYHKIVEKFIGIDHCGDCAQLCEMFEIYPRFEQKFEKIMSKLHIQLWEPHGHGNYLQHFTDTQQVINMQTAFARKHLSLYADNMKPPKLTPGLAQMYSTANKIITMLDIPKPVKISISSHLSSFLLFSPSGRFCAQIINWVCYGDYALGELLRTLLIKLFTFNSKADIAPPPIPTPACYSFAGDGYSLHCQFRDPFNKHGILFGEELDQYLPENYELWTPYMLVNINSPRVTSRKYFLSDSLPKTAHSARVIMLLGLSLFVSLYIEQYFVNLGHAFVIIYRYDPKEENPGESRIYPTQIIGKLAKYDCIEIDEKIRIYRYTP